MMALLPRLLAVLTGLCLFTLAWCGVAVAEKRVALVVANGAYEEAPLSNPRTDMALVVPALEAMGFTVTAVADADFVAFDDAVNTFVRDAEGADIALFYFAGHGFALNDGLQVQNYLMATSADVTSPSDRVLRRDGIALDEIIALVTSSAKTSLVFVDACRNDPRVRSTRGGAGRGLAPISAATEGDVFVGLSTRLGDVAADGVPGEGSPFARAFVENMSTPGLNVPFAFNKVRLAVQKETGIQRPEANRVDLSNPEAVVLVAALAPVEETSRDVASAPDEDRAYQEWLSIQNLDSPAAFAAFAKAYPDSRYAQYALARIDVLTRETGGDTPGPLPDAEDQTGPVDQQTADLGPAESVSLPAMSTIVLSRGAPVTDCDRIAAVAFAHVPEIEIGPQHYDYKGLAERGLAPCLEAVRLYPQEPRFAFQLAWIYQYGGKSTESLKWLEAAAEMDFPPARSLLGGLYITGEGGVEKDPVRGSRLLDEGIAKNDLTAALYRAYSFFTGSDTSIDAATALGMLTDAANAGSAEAMHLLAGYYSNGMTGIEPDKAQARQWYEKAARLGLPDAMYALAELHVRGKEPEDRKSAIDWYQGALDAGQERALLPLLRLYTSGETTDPERAADLFLEDFAFEYSGTLPLLEVGSDIYSPAVFAALQRRLTEAGVYGGATDGAWGADSLAAVETYIETQKLARDAATKPGLEGAPDPGPDAIDVASLDYGQMMPGYTTRSPLLNAGKHTINIARAPVHECDRLAADNVEHVGGVDGVIRIAAITAKAALVACTEAVAQFPDEPRFLVQLALAQVRARVPDADPTELCERARELGLAFAMARTLACGKVPRTEEEKREALRWLQKGAELGSPEAMVQLAHYYIEGTVVTRDRPRAKALIQEAATLGNPFSMGQVALSSYWAGSADDKLAVVPQLRRAAENGDITSAQTLYREVFAAERASVDLKLSEDERAVEAARYFLLYYMVSGYVRDFEAELDIDTRKAVQILLRDMKIYSGAVDGEGSDPFLVALEAFGQNPTPNLLDYLASLDASQVKLEF